MAETKNRHITLWVILILLLLAIAGTIAYIFYNKTQKANEEDAEQAAWMKIQKWEGMMQLDSLETAIAQYQNIFIHGLHADMVEAIRSKIDIERKDWAKAQQSESIEDIEDFVRNHSDSHYRNEASRKIDSLSYAEALDEDTYSAYERYLDSFGDGLYATEAQKRMDDLDSGKLSDKETDNVTNMIYNHFTALANADAAALKRTVTTILTSYIGQNDASKADVEQYMKRMHTNSNRTISFNILNPIVTKETESHIPTYSIQFVLEEQVTQGGNSNSINFLGKAKLNSEFLIEELMLSQK